jgi:dipeptidyl-peptidase-4
MSPHSLLRAAAAVLLCSGSLGAQALPAPVDSALHAIFAGGRGGGGRGGGGGGRWRPDGAHYLALEPSSGGQGRDIVEYDAATGAREVKVPASLFVPPGQSTPLAFQDYTFSADGKRLLLFTNTRKVWRENTRGDYWILDLTGKALHQVAGGKVAPSSLMFAKFSPDGASIAYVRDGDVYVEPAAGGASTRLTRTGSASLVNGMSDWVYEEEFGLRDGFRWSPDSKQIAFWQFDMSGVRNFLLINDTDSLYPFTTPVQYPKAGQTNSAVRIGVVSVAGGAITWAKLPGDPRQDYVPWMQWSRAGEVILQRMNRLQNHNDVMLVDAATGAARTIHTDSDSAWVEVVQAFRWMNDGKDFLWTSEKDGWRHLYLVSRDGGNARLITPGDYDVVSIAGIDEKNGSAYVIASPTNATQRYLYRVSLKTPGPPQRVTPAGQDGTHDYQISPTAAFAFHSFSSFDTPPTAELIRLPDHTAIPRPNAGPPSVAAKPKQPVEYFKVTTGDGTTVDGWLLKPATFDAARRYPILVQVYSEPAGQTVADRWGGATAAWHRMLADQGYLVVSFDNKGTPAPRGRAWRKSIYGAIGPTSSRQQAEAVRAFARTRPYADSSRIAIWGWSGGGSATLNAMFRYPDVYKVGMAVAPVADQHLYDSIYEERYVGLPSTNEEGYRAGSPVNFAEGLKGKLLVVHGSGDDNVHYQGTERLVNRLVTLGKPFDLMVYPNRSHCICEGAGTTLHVYTLLTRYLLTNLPPAEARAGQPTSEGR